MLELAILGLLKEQHLHGYELKKRLADTLGVASGVSFGSLYPALGRLERAGAVRTVEDTGDAPAVPQTGSLSGEFAALRARAGGPRRGRSRKVYAITPHGEELFEQLLAAESAASDDNRLFHLRLAFARYLSADARLGMLERRRAQLVERLDRTGARTRGAGRLVDRYVDSVIQHDREVTEHDLSWVERLIAGERAVPERPAPAAAAVSAPSLSGLRPGPAPDPSVGRLAPAPVPTATTAAHGATAAVTAAPVAAVAAHVGPATYISGPTARTVSGPVAHTNQEDTRT